MASSRVSPWRLGGRLLIMTVADPSITTPGPCGGTGEWRLGRNKPGGEALSFINLDAVPTEAVLRALGEIEAVTQVKVVHL